jgi:hypothetical protein
MKLEPVTAEPYRSQGHLGVPPHLVTRVSAGARDAYLSLVTDSKLPADMVVAATHEAAPGDPGPSYVMERRAGAWRYLVLDVRGRVLGDSPGECAGCHAGGVAEGLFGPPRPKPPPVAGRE